MSGDRLGEIEEFLKNICDQRHMVIREGDELRVVNHQRRVLFSVAVDREADNIKASTTGKVVTATAQISIGDAKNHLTKLREFIGSCIEALP